MLQINNKKISQYLGLHYTTVSKIIKKGKMKKDKARGQVTK